MWPIHLIPWLVERRAPDDMELKSCMTLFHVVNPEEEVFLRVLEKYFGGEVDEKTIELLGKDSRDL